VAKKNEHTRQQWQGKEIDLNKFAKLGLRFNIQLHLFQQAVPNGSKICTVGQRI
jgi:hypothetical protein